MYDRRIQSGFRVASLPDVEAPFQNQRLPMSFSLRSWLGLLCAVGLLTALSACDSGGANDSGSVTGVWQGTVETDSITYELTLSLERAEGTTPSNARLIGDGDLVGEDTWAFQITDGSFTEPNRALALTFRIDSALQHPVQLQGTVGDDFQEIEAELNGGPPDGELPTFEAEAVTFTRP